MPLVQGIRGLAALLVALFHLAAGGQIPQLLQVLLPSLRIDIFEWWPSAVQVFFVLSGFVIAHALRDAVVTAEYFWLFVLRRSIRLDPPYWGAILICILVMWLAAELKHQAFQPPSPGDVAAHIIYAQELLRVPEINIVFWTLTFEIQCYLVMCGSLFLVNEASRRGWAFAKPIMLAILLAIAMWSAAGFTTWVMPGLFVHMWYAFFGGVLAYWSIADKAFRVPFMLLIIAMLLPLERDNRESAIICAVISIFFFVSGVSGWLYRGLRWLPFQQLGLISYSLYLLHMPIMRATAFLGRKIHGYSVAADMAILVETMAASVLVAIVYYIAVERTARLFSRRILVNRMTKAALAPASISAP